MIKNFDELLEAATRPVRPKIAVAVAHDKKVLSAIKLASELGLADAILVGKKELIEKLAEEIELNLTPHTIISVEDEAKACKIAIQLVREGKAVLPMKGLVPTDLILKAVLNREEGLRTQHLLSHVGVFSLENFPRLLLISDAAMNIAPDEAAKAMIIENTCAVALALGISNPKIALVCATEKVNAKMQATLDAQKLVERNHHQQHFKPALLGGPFGLDNAISAEAAAVKKIADPVAGKADALIVPDIEAGNILNKALEYFAKARKAGVVMGARVPIVLTSRASSDLSKMYSIALALLIQNQQEMGEEHG